MDTDRCVQCGRYFTDADVKEHIRRKGLAKDYPTIINDPTRCAECLKSLTSQRSAELTIQTEVASLAYRN